MQVLGRKQNKMGRHFLRFVFSKQVILFQLQSMFKLKGGPLSQDVNNVEQSTIQKMNIMGKEGEKQGDGEKPYGCPSNI